MKIRIPEEAVRTELGRKPLFSAEMENELAEYLLFVETLLFGLPSQDGRRLAYYLNFSRFKGTGGKDWLYGFLNQYKNTCSLGSPTEILSA
jgi:hypothetical protein